MAGAFFLGRAGAARPAFFGATAFFIGGGAGGLFDRPVAGAAPADCGTDFLFFFSSRPLPWPEERPRLRDPDFGGDLEEAGDLDFALEDDALDAGPPPAAFAARAPAAFGRPGGGAALGE